MDVLESHAYGNGVNMPLALVTTFADQQACNALTFSQFVPDARHVRMDMISRYLPIVPVMILLWLRSPTFWVDYELIVFDFVLAILAQGVPNIATDQKVFHTDGPYELCELLTRLVKHW